MTSLECQLEAELIEKLRDLKYEYREDIKGFKISCPRLPEQTQIADCLSSLDARIASEADKLAALKSHKQALMQQHFPSPEGD